MATEARKANEGLDLTGRTAVLSGASQGIGAATAIRFAQAGANVIILGRNRQLLEQVVTTAKAAAKSPSQQIDYITTDFSLISSTKTAASEITTKSHGSVDYLIMTQGGTPNGSHDLTSEGIETHFAVQVLSRFALTHILASTGVLRSAAVTILAPGGTQTSFDLDDIELRSAKDNARISQIAGAASRDGLVTDAVTKYFQARYPGIRFFHVFPGLVQTNIAMNMNLPFGLKYLLTYVLYPIAARTVGNTASGYAEVPVFLAANEKAGEMVVEKEGYFLSEKNKAAVLSPYALDERNQKAVFEKLKGYLA